MTAAGQAAHLGRRFFGSLWPVGPGGADESWVNANLTDDERVLWGRMSAPDRRHAVAVAHRVQASLDAQPSLEPVGPVGRRAILAAALLHDVGKVESRMGTFGRVVATVVGMTGGRRRSGEWATRSGLRRRLGVYLRHDSVGAELLAAAGGDPLTVGWASCHHRPVEQWCVPTEVGVILKSADDD